MPVVINSGAVVCRAQLDAANFLQPSDAAVDANLDYYVAELGWISQPALRVQRVLESRTVLGEGRTTDDSGGHLDVLLSHRSDDVARSHVSRRHLIPIEPQAHRV